MIDHKHYLTKQEFCRMYEIYTRVGLAEKTGLTLRQIEYRAKKYNLAKKKAGRPETIK